MVLACALAAATSAARSQTAPVSPEALYDRLAPSIVMVGRFDAKGKLTGVGSGVVIGPGQVVTNCHVLRRASSVQIKSGNAVYEAKLRYPDVSRDLCQLEVKELNAPAVEIASLDEVRVGQKVYALGNPRGLERTFSDGLVSALRTAKDEPMIQTTAPVSPGSSGGGLFNARGKLIGITTLAIKEAQNINFAVPAEWIRELPERGQAAITAYQRPALAAAATAGVAAGPPRPNPVVNVDGVVEQPDIRIGDTWKYRVTDRYTNLGSTVVVEVTAVTATRIVTRSAQSSSEASLVSAAGGVEEEWDRNWNLLRTGDNVYTPNYPSLRFPLESGKRWTGRVSFQDGDINVVEDVSAHIVGWERITVPAGSFDSVKIILGAQLRASGTGYMTDTGELKGTIWYSPLIRNVVRQDVERIGFGLITGSSASAAAVIRRNDRRELLEYKSN